MKYLILLFIGLWFFTACMTTKRIEKHCDDFAKICITDVKKEVEIITNTVTEIEYRDTIIYLEIQGKEVVKQFPIFIDKKGIVNSDLSILSVPFARSTAQVINSKLRHELMQTDTIMRVELENALKVTKTQEKQIETLREKYVVTIKENTNWAKFCIKVVWGLLVVIVLGTGYLIFRFRSKFLGLFK